MGIMEGADFDAIVIGGGFYGSIISIYLSQYKKLKRILILENKLMTDSLILDSLKDEYTDAKETAVESEDKANFYRGRYTDAKNKIIYLENSYHGETLGALSVTDIPIFSDTYSLLTRDPIIIASPDARLAKPNQTSEDYAHECLQDLEEILQSKHQTIACIIVEPMVQCATGMAMYSPTYLKGLRSLCDQYQIHLIADEIAVLAFGSKLAAGTPKEISSNQQVKEVYFGSDEVNA